MIDLTPEQKSRFRDLASRLSPGAQAGLDPRKGEDRALIEDFLDLAGKRSDRYPALHAALAEDAPLPAGPGDDLRLVDLGVTGDGRATARAWHASRGGALVSGSAVLALDSESGEPLAFGAATRVGESLTPAATDHESAKEGGDGVTGLAFFHSQRTPEAQPSFGVALASRSNPGALIQGIQANVVDPSIHVSTHTIIRIAIGRVRGVQSCSDADYCYYDSQNLTDPNLLVPFKGTVSLPGRIEGVSPNPPHTIANLGLSTQLYAHSTYLNCVKPSPLTAHVTVPDPVNAPGELAWEYKYDQEPQEKTESLQYQGIGGLPQDLPASFFFEFAVPVEGLGTVSFSVCSGDYPKPHSVNCTAIPSLELYWHCLAAGTEVTLADGTALPVEAVDNTMRVRTGVEGETLGVEATTRGHHFDEGGPGSGVCELVTEGGRRLRLTASHPVASDRGLVAAGDLAAGSTVRTVAGPERIESATRVPAEGMYCNLKLVDEEDRSQGRVPEYATFLANGLVVGDSAALLDHYRSTRVDREHMLERLPDSYHRDYTSAIEDTLASRP